MSYQQKIEKAIAYLGPRWICHASRRVQALRKADQADVHKANVADTFRRVRRAMEKEAQA